MKKRLAIALGLAMMAVSAGAAAQTPAQAKRFGAAQKLYDQGAYTPAYQEFKALAEETKSPNAELQAARCLRELGKLPEAYEAMSQALRNATARAETETKYAATRNAAAADLALLEPKVGKVIIAVMSPPPGLAVTIDGAPLPEGKLGVPVATAIGEVVVRLRAPGSPDVERRVQTRGGQPVTVTISLGAAPPAADKPAPQQAPSPAPEPAMQGGGTRIGGFVVLGLGAAGIATFAAAGVMADKRYDEIKTACGGTRCTDPSFNDRIAGGRTLDIVANVGLGAGIAGIAAGTLMVVFGGPKAAPPVSAWFAPGGGGLVARGSF